MYICTCAKSLRSCWTLHNPMRYSPPGSPMHGFSRQAYWSGLPRPPPGDIPDPRIKPASFRSPALAGVLFITSDTWEAIVHIYIVMTGSCCCTVETNTTLK